MHKLAVNCVSQEEREREREATSEMKPFRRQSAVCALQSSACQLQLQLQLQPQPRLRFHFHFNFVSFSGIRLYANANKDLYNLCLGLLAALVVDLAAPFAYILYATLQLQLLQWATSLTLRMFLELAPK